MPELPEVETFARGLSFALRGLSIREVVLYREKNIQSDVATFASSLLGASFLDVARRGKYLLFRLDNGFTLLSHLRMEGKWKAFEGEYLPNKATILSFRLSDSRLLVYEDVRKFGTLELKKNEELEVTPPLNALGQEPLEISFADFFSGLRKRHRPIKEVLLEQSFLAGIGNIYADESLFASGIHPLQKASSLSEAQAKTLYAEMRRILDLAIRLRGSSIHSYVAAFSTLPSSMQERLLIYGKREGYCPKCGKKTTFISVGGRGTTFCPFCQKRKDAPFRLALTGPIHAGKSLASAYLSSQGIPVFDADREVAKLYERKDVLEALTAFFGKKALKNKRVDRAFLRERFASDPDAKEQWMAILYPFLMKEYRLFLHSYADEKIVVLDVPLLYSSPFRKEFDALLLIESSEEIRRLRLEKEGRDASRLLALNASYPLKQTEKIATFLIKNEGDVPSYLKQVEAVLSTIRRCR